MKEKPMGQLLIRNVPDETIATFKQKADLNGRSLEQELRELLERNQPFTPEERVALSRSFRARHDGVQPSLTLEEIREGLE
jgi:plasmid stability protein